MQRPIPTDKEIFFKNKSMITETDVKGRIIYADHDFLEVTGYNFHKLLGLTHSIIRHPDTPKVIFTEMWNTIRQGSNWYGYVKNLTKDGSFWWSHVNITPRWDEYGKIIGFIAVRKIPDPTILNKIKKEYEVLLKHESDNKSIGNVIHQ